MRLKHEVTNFNCQLSRTNSIKVTLLCNAAKSLNCQHGKFENEIRRQSFDRGTHNVGGGLGLCQTVAIDFFIIDIVVFMHYLPCTHVRLSYVLYFYLLIYLLNLFMNIQKYMVSLLTLTGGFDESKARFTSVVIAFAGNSCA